MVWSGEASDHPLREPHPANRGRNANGPRKANYRFGVHEPYNLLRMHGKQGMAMGKLQLLAAVLAAGLVSAWTTALLITRPQNAPPGTYAPTSDFSELNARLDDLVRALQPLSARMSVQSGEPTADRTPVEDTEAWTEVARSLQEIRGLVGRQPRASGNENAELAAAALRQVGMRQQMVADLRQRLDTETTATKQSLMFLTPAVVLQRFGRPTMITVRPSGAIRWTYLVKQPDGTTIQVRISFMDGYVISVS